jgi:hypothetical protein
VVVVFWVVVVFAVVVFAVVVFAVVVAFGVEVVVFVQVKPFSITTVVPKGPNWPPKVRARSSLIGYVAQ